jgi:signal transduction histidine kinase
LSGTANRVQEITIPFQSGALLAQVRFPDAVLRSGQISRFIALYTISFAITLLLFTYFVLTRIIVQPIEQLVKSAEKVATGSRAFSAPNNRVREIQQLGVSLTVMTGKLLAEEETLRAKIDELTRTTQNLIETREQLIASEHLASVGRLAAGIAHEVGNPLAAILGMEDLLIAGDLPPDVQQDFLHRIRKETLRIHDVVRDLLDFARPETKDLSRLSVEPNRGVSHVKTVLDEVAELLRHQPIFRYIQLSIEVEDTTNLCIIDPKRLSQVVLNLSLNAMDALSERMQSSKDSDYEPRIRWTTSVRDGETTLTIEDNGAGIPETVRQRIFEPFVTTKPVGQGTGLGLSVCRGLIEAVGGTIYLDQHYTNGARFVLKLPSCSKPVST